MKISEHVLSSLGFDILLNNVSNSALSEPGREGVLKLSPFLKAEDLARELKCITEMKELLQFDDPFVLAGFNFIENYLKRAEVPGSFIDAKGILEINVVLKISSDVKDYISSRRDKYPVLNSTASNISVIKDVEKEIEHAIGPDAVVLDRASRELAVIRQHTSRLESRSRSLLERILKTAVSKGWAQEDTLAVKQGSLVIPVKESFKGRVKGIVVDQSASGQTVFVAPFEVLEIENQIRRLKADEKSEIEKILTAITDRIREHSYKILQNFHVLVFFDTIYARARFSAEFNCMPAETGGEIRLKNGYHPLLLLKQKRENIVPLSIELGGEIKTIVITGPNAGGKTVALKTIGILALMHAFGMHVPADSGSEIPLFSKIFIDIGDEQSIEQGLSSFSSHIETIKSIVNECDNSTLILLDEIGSATDPAEGAALAEVLLRYFTKKGAITIATTHMGSLKVFASQEPGVENGSMAFNRDTLMPTYLFRTGIPGSSYAFEISERLGLKKELIEEARAITGDDRGSLDRLILTMEEKYQKASEILQEAEIKESKLSGLVKLYDDRLTRLKQEGEKEKEKIIENAEALLNEANAAVEKIVKEIREQKASKESIKRAKSKITEIKSRVKELSPKQKPQNGKARPGDYVKWKGHKGRGKVESEPDKSGRVLVQWGDLRLKVPVSELSILEENRAEQRHSAVAVSYSVEQASSDELDLRGMTAFEAEQELDKFLGRAAISGINHVRIIHGKGTGVLRKTVNNVLKNHKFVKRSRLGNYREGDTGVTIAELK